MHKKAIKFTTKKRISLSKGIRLFYITDFYIKEDLILNLSCQLIILAGTPTTVALSGTSLSTTALAPILELFPIFIAPSILAPEPIKTLLPISGCLLNEESTTFPVPPKVTP